MSHRSYSPLWELTRARVLEFVRSPGTIFWVFVFPVLLAVALGIAFRNRPAEAIRVAVLGSGREQVIEVLEKQTGFQVKDREEHAALRDLRTGKIDILVRVNRDAEGPLFLYRFDPTRPEARQARMTLDDALQRGLGRKDVARIAEDKTIEPGGRYIDFLIPGLIGLNIMSSCMWGIGYAVVDSRKRKLLKRFAATPMRHWHFLASFALSRLLFLVAEVAALLLFGALVFDIAIYGSYGSVVVFSLLGTFAFSGLALLIAARVRDTEVASGWMNFAMLPMWLLSGAFFDYSRFPEVLFPFIRALPLTALNDGLRAVINEGSSLASCGWEITVLMAWGFVGFAIALFTFRWR